MMLKRFLSTALLFVSAFSAAGLSAAGFSAAASDKLPNILVLMAEDLSPRIGAFGDSVARTPNIDRLAESGVRFPNTFTTAGVCAPSRASFITGVHQITLGAQHMRTSTSPVARYLAVPPVEVKAFPELLRRAGYYTFTDRKLDYQFSGVGANSGPPTIWDAEGAADHLAEIPADAPFFGLINLFVTHESYTFEPAATVSDFGRATATRAAAARAALEHRTPVGAVDVPPYYPDLPEVRRHIADHYDNVQVMDAQVGSILTALATRDLLDDTIVIWTTDHGDGLPRNKRELFDSGIRVPMIIRWPAALRAEGMAPGTVDQRLISFVDLAPFILTSAGVEPPDYLHGRNPFAADGKPRHYVYASRDRMDEQPDRVRAVRDERFKYLRYFLPGTPGATHLAYRDQGRIMQALWSLHDAGRLTPAQAAWFEPRPEEALYDLHEDPHELVNLVDDANHQEVLTRLRSAYGAWRLTITDTSDLPEAQLAAAFWPEGVQPITPAPRFETIDGNRVSLLAEHNASIEYRYDDGKWRLYESPLTLPVDQELKARAVRYGYAVSAEVSVPPPAP